jgi:hypothetical protein
VAATTITTSANILFGLHTLTGSDTVSAAITNENDMIKPPPIMPVTLTADLQPTSQNSYLLPNTVTVTQPPSDIISMAMFVTYAVIGVLLFFLVLFWYKQMREAQQRKIADFR